MFDLFKNKYYDLVVSIGEECATAMHLNDCSLRLKSYPFDWVNGASFVDRVHIIISEFKHWIDKELLELYLSDHDPENYRYIRYKNTKTSIYFHHDFLKTCTFEQNYKDVNIKYDRRIKRFLNAFNYDTILFVFKERRSTASDQELIDAMAAINKFSAKAKVDLLYIRNDSSLPMNKVKGVMVNSNILKLTLNNAPSNRRSRGTRFKGNILMVNKVLKNIKLTKTLKIEQLEENIKQNIQNQSITNADLSERLAQLEKEFGKTLKDSSEYANVKIKASSLQALKNIIFQCYFKKKAFALCNSGKIYEAEAIAQSIIHNTPYMSWAYYIMGKCQWSQGNHESSLKNLQRAMDLDSHIEFYKIFYEKKIKEMKKNKRIIW